MLMDGKVAIVTGASSGIGRASALRMALEGAVVVAVGRNEMALREVAAELEKAGRRVTAVAMDVTSADAPVRIVDAAVTAHGRIDMLVNAAGIIGGGTIETTTDEGWDEMLDINLRAPFRLLRAAVPHLARGRGAVVNVSSVTGLRSFPGVLAYCVSKAGIDQLTRCAALELASRGVRVNAVNPGVTVTNLHRRSGMVGEAYEAFLQHSKATHPLGRTGKADEIADLIVFLASDRASWITGETIAIDGGRHLTCAR